MLKNLPVINIERHLREDQYLMSKTDLKGRITYCNPTFVDISGFSREELMKKAHNVVRHPDMPPAGFQDLWDTLQSGRSWLGIVKNRAKDGSYYWVKANASPIVEDGKVTGYSSVRSKPSLEEINQAEAFYKKAWAGNTGGYTIKGGQIVPTGWRRALEAIKYPFSRGIGASLFRIAAIVCAGAMPAAAALILPSVGAMITPAMAIAWYVLFAGGVVISTFMMRHGVLNSIAGAEEIACQIAGGNLRVEITNQLGEMNRLYFYLDIMRKSLTGLSNEVMEKATLNKQSIQLMRDGARNIAARADDQAASLQETSASMEQITVTIKQNTDNARSANDLSNHSMDVAQKGGDEVGNVVEMMHEINNFSKKIANIVQVIDSISFQTNILALNAAVEAARAGEQGKGFAVVASEVRNLAGRSAQAAKEIKNLIDESVSRMAEGSRRAESAGDTMKDIVKSVRQVTDIVREISTASEEQAKGVEQINLAISQMDTTTTQNAMLVKDLSTTTDHLSRESNILLDAVQALSTDKTKGTIDKTPE